MTAIRPVDARIQWLLAIAALCMLAQSSLVPLAAQSVEVWTPVHRHLTLNGSAPPHTHDYERIAGQHAATAAGCIVTETPPGATVVHDERVVCAPSDEAASGSVTALATLAAAPADATAAAIESRAWLLPVAGWHSAVVAILTPPPRA